MCNNVLFNRETIHDMHPSAERLYMAAEHLCGVTGQSAVARLLNESPQTVKNWETRGVSKAGVLSAQAIIGSNPLWLATGEGPMRADAAVLIDLDGNPDYPAIRRVRFKLSAGASGFGIEYSDEDAAPIVFQRAWFERHGYKPANLFAVRVANGSMEPGLYDGDTVVVDTADTKPLDGAVFAVNYEGELVIKRLVRDAGQWWLSSDNPNQAAYPRKVCDAGSIIIGRIVHKQSERI